ncbi:histidine kinase [Planomonospora parontospora]|uniref:histidine kinase n=1 Tax=Planomonospora parontospora TaxID=58119 RepID=UPI00360A2F57
MSHRPPPTVVDWTVAVAVALFVALFVAVTVSVTGPPGAGDVAVALLMAVAAGGAGVAVRRHRRLAVRARELAVQAEERGELLAREAVTEERVRIARELHDVVAHSVSVMVMQAGGAADARPRPGRPARGADRGGGDGARGGGGAAPHGRAAPHRTGRGGARPPSPAWPGWTTWWSRSARRGWRSP